MPRVGIYVGNYYVENNEVYVIESVNPLLIRPVTEEELERWNEGDVGIDG